MPRGGARPGSGRKKGVSKVRATSQKAIQLVSKGKQTPLEYMTGVMSGEIEYDENKFKAAVAAAPYMHARFQAIEHSGAIAAKHEEDLSRLEKLARDNAIAASSSDQELDELEQRVLN